MAASGAAALSSEMAPPIDADVSAAIDAAEGRLRSQEPPAGNTEPMNLLQQIEELRRTQKNLKDERKRVAKEVKNALKRKKRLKSRASQLTDDDLLEVLRMRQSLAQSSSPPLALTGPGSSAGSSTAAPIAS